MKFNCDWVDTALVSYQSPALSRSRSRASPSSHFLLPLMATASASILKPLLLTVSPSPQSLDRYSRFVSSTPFLSFRQSPLSRRSKPASSSSSTPRLGTIMAVQSNFIKGSLLASFCFSFLFSRQRGRPSLGNACLLKCIKHRSSLGRWEGEA